MQQKSSVHAFLPFRPPKCAALAHGRRAGVVRPKAGACDVLSGSLSEEISWVILAFFVGCVKAGGSGARCAARGLARGIGGCAAGRSFAGGLQRRVLPAFYAARGAGGCAAGRGFACERPRKPLPSHCAARGGGCAAGRGFACERPGSRFLRAAPRGVLRWRGARRALRPLFLLRSCAADQEKRPEKKSWAVTACVSLRLERLWGTCIRSAPRCISRGQREEGGLLAARERFWGWVLGVGFVELVLCGGASLASGPESRFLRAAPRGGLRWRGAAGRCGRFSCFAHAPLIKKSGQKRNHGLLWPALPSGQSA